MESIVLEEKSLSNQFRAPCLQVYLPPVLTVLIQDHKETSMKKYYDH